MTVYRQHAAPPRLDDAALARLAGAHLRGARLIVDYKAKGRWHQHLNGPMDHADLLAEIADSMARRRGIEEVALSVEVRDSMGRYIRRRLLHVPAEIPARRIDRSPIAGFDAGQWTAFIGSWLEQVDNPPPTAAETESVPMRKPPAPPIDPAPEPAPRGFLARLGIRPGIGFGFGIAAPKPLAGPSEIQTAALALGIPALAFALFLGLQLNALAGHGGADRVAPALAQDAANRLALADIPAR